MPPCVSLRTPGNLPQAKQSYMDLTQTFLAIGYNPQVQPKKDEKAPGPGKPSQRVHFRVRAAS